MFCNLDESVPFLSHYPTYRCAPRRPSSDMNCDTNHISIKLPRYVHGPCGKKHRQNLTRLTPPTQDKQVAQPILTKVWWSSNVRHQLNASHLSQDFAKMANAKHLLDAPGERIIVAMASWYSSSMNVTRKRNLCLPGLYRGDV